MQQIDFNGKHDYSNVQKIQWNETTAALRFYPNPVNTILTIRGLSGVNNISVFNTLGQVVLQKSTTLNETSKQLDFSQFTNGVYFIKVTNSAGVIANSRIVKK